VYESKSDQALITLIDMDFVSFHFIDKEFKYFFNNYMPYSKDRSIVEREVNESVWPSLPRLMTASDGLGLVLTWMQTCGSTMVLQMLLGMTQTSMSDYLPLALIFPSMPYSRWMTEK
jgi:hypothetical protein